MNWGMIGCGDIARKTAKAMTHLPGERLRAVASRDLAKARAFATEVGAEYGYGSYDELIADPAVDIVYVATPHPQHHVWTLAALAAGKHVLCEKPMALNASETREMITAARRHDRFLMEAVWMRFTPGMTALRAAVASGIIGELRLVQADTAYRVPLNPDSRLFRPDLAGGGLMDIGIYGVSAAVWFMGVPKSIQSAAHIGVTGVDEQAAILLSFAGGGIGQITAGVRTATSGELRLYGTDGWIRVQPGFTAASAWDLMRPGQPVETRRFSDPPPDRRHMMQAVAQCVGEGRREHPAMPLADSQTTADIMNTCRNAWGLRYPQEG